MSASSKRMLVDVAQVGEPPAPKKLKPHIETVQFKFHNFESLSHSRGERILSPVVQAHGHPWKMMLYPGGEECSSKKTAHVSCFVGWDGKSRENCPYAIFTFHMKNKSRGPTELDNILHLQSEEARGYADFHPRKKVISDYLEDGTLTLDVDIQIAEVKPDNWYPKKLQQNEFLFDLYHSSDCADIKFFLNSETFSAHKAVLRKHCKELYDMVEGASDEQSIVISGISNTSFTQLLEYIYTVKEPEWKDLNTIKEVLVQANRFGVIGLKMSAESTLAYEFLCPGNTADLLVFSHSQCCPLLKEECMKLYTSNPESIIATEGWKMVQESPDLIYELLVFSSITSKMIKDDSKVETLDVATLCTRLDELGLDIDGSREVLVARLKESDSPPESDSD